MINALESCTSICFKNILFLTDLTETSQVAYTYALALARHYKARIYPAHAIPPYIPTELEVTVTTDILKEVETKTREQLDKLGRKVEAGHLSLVTHQSLEEAVPRWIRELGIDLIVMGTSGRRGLGRFLLGSTAETIFRTATCPVLTVGPHVPPQRSEDLDFNKILFATDLSQPSETAASYAASCARERLAHLTFLHVLPEGTRHQPDASDLHRFALDELAKLAPASSELWHEPEFIVEEGDAGEQILHQARNQHADLIVLGLPQDKRFSPHFRAGVTYRVVSSAPCAVLTIRDLTPTPEEEFERDVVKLGGC